MSALHPDPYDYDLPQDDDCWHLDEPRHVDIKLTHEGRTDTIESYRRVGINARNAWPTSKGTGVKVVVLDNGVEYQHPSLWPAIEPVFEEARDFDHGFEQNGRPPSAGGRIANRFNAHGTACAGIVAARRPAGSRMIGVAPEAYLVPVRVATNFEVHSLINALHYAHQVGDVILLPRFLPEGGQQEVTGVIKSIAAQKPLVCAAGNLGTASLIHPAFLKDTIAVGACNERGYRSTYSQYGEGLDVIAPSNDLAAEDQKLIRLDTDEVIYRLAQRRDQAARANGTPLPAPPLSLRPLEDLAAVRHLAQDRNWNLDRAASLAIATTDNLGGFGYNYDPMGNYCYASGDFGFGGTSAAAAQVAGVVALMLSKNRNLTVVDIRDILRQTATVNDLRTEAGHGPQKPSPEFGYGLVDAAAAVDAA